MSTGADKAKQSRMDQSGGTQVTGRAPTPVILNVPNFQGKSGQSDNQSTKRPKGHS